MAVDYAFYTAIRGTDNWGQRRQDKMMNMQILEKRAQIEDQKRQASMMAEEKLNQYYDELANMDVLPEDQERIRQLEMSSRANIIKGISKYNGDLNRYMASGGISDIHDYRNSIVQSQEVKQALQNKDSLKRYLDASQKGLFVHKVNVPIPKRDAEGNPVLDKNGNQVMENRRMSFDENYKLFKEGIVNNLNFNGAEKKVNLNPFMFLQRPKNPADPYSPDNIVTASNVMFQAQEMGASQEYAEEIARQYVARTKAGGDPWRWGNLSQLDKMEKEASVAYKMATAKKMMAGDGTDASGWNNRYRQILTGQGYNPTTGVANEWENNEGGVGAKVTSHNITREDMGAVANAMGLRFDKANADDVKDKDGEFINAEDLVNPNLLADTRFYSPRTGRQYDLANNNYSVIGFGGPIHRVNGESYVQTKIYTNEEALDGMGVRSEAGFDHIVDGWKGLVEDVGGGGMTGDNYIITGWTKLNDSPAVQDQASKKLLQAKFKEEAGVEGTGRGYGEFNPVMRDFFQ